MITFCFLAFFCNAEPVTESTVTLTQTGNASTIQDGKKSGNIRVDN